MNTTGAAALCYSLYIGYIHDLLIDCKNSNNNDNNNNPWWVSVSGGVLDHIH